MLLSGMQFIIRIQQTLKRSKILEPFVFLFHIFVFKMPQDMNPLLKFSYKINTKISDSTLSSIYLKCMFMSSSVQLIDKY